MKNAIIVPVIFCAILMTFSFVSCDLLITYWQRTSAQEELINFIFHDQYQGLKDEVIVRDGGKIEFRRLEGGELPDASRALNKDEFAYIKNLFDNFYALDSEYIEYDESTTTLYTITYYGEDGEKTVRCDNSIYANSRKLRSIVTELMDFRSSLIGEKRFAGKLSFEFKPESEIVTSGEPVVLRCKVTNDTHEEIEMQFGNLQQLGYKIYRDGELLFEFPQAFLPSMSWWEVQPLSTEVQTIEWEQIMVDETGDHYIQVESGTYTIVQYLLDSNSPFRANEVTIDEKD